MRKMKKLNNKGYNVVNTGTTSSTSKTMIISRTTKAKAERNGTISGTALELALENKSEKIYFYCS